MEQQDRTFLESLFFAAVEAADAERILAANLPAPPKGRTVVVGAGKGVAQLAAALEEMWETPVSGVVVTRYGYGCATKRIRVLEASHPVPDLAGLAASYALLDAVSELTPDDLVIALFCGGGSALLPCPLDGLCLDDEIALNEALLASGAPISVMNAVRSQISAIKGGRLAAAAAPARVVSLIVSDVPGDDPAQVASGPTVPSPLTRADVRRLIANWQLRLPPVIEQWLENDRSRSPMLEDPVFRSHEVRVIASAKLSLEAAAQAAADQGVTGIILSDAMEGEARDVGYVHAALAREIAVNNRPFRRPVVMLSGGETTVTMRGHGRGGRNSEFLLAFAAAAQNLPVAAIAADTDGIDGSESNAGAFACGESDVRLRRLGRDAGSFLSNNDAYSAFEILDDLFITGPTGTNVNDFRAILIR